MGSLSYLNASITMATPLFEVKGFKELQQQLKTLPDKVKRKQVVKILRRASRDTVKEARRQAPKDTGVGAKSIRFEALRRSKNPGGIVGPRSRGKYDGWYMRQFVIPGHNIYRRGFKRNRRGNRVYNARGARKQVAANPFMERAYEVTRGRVLQSSVPALEKYIQQQINRL